MSRNINECLNNDMPDNWWDYGINPILGYRYMPDGKSKPVRFREEKNNRKNNVNTNTKT